MGALIDVIGLAALVGTAVAIWKLAFTNPAKRGTPCEDVSPPPPRPLASNDPTKGADNV